MSPSCPWSPTRLLDCSGRPQEANLGVRSLPRRQTAPSVPQRGLRLSPELPRSKHGDGVFLFPGGLPCSVAGRAVVQMQ